MWRLGETTYNLGSTLISQTTPHPFSLFLLPGASNSDKPMPSMLPPQLTTY